jgi:hypothetical protein
MMFLEIRPRAEHDGVMENTGIKAGIPEYGIERHIFGLIGPRHQPTRVEWASDGPITDHVFIERSSRSQPKPPVLESRGTIDVERLGPIREVGRERLLARHGVIAPEDGDRRDGSEYQDWPVDAGKA